MHASVEGVSMMGVKVRMKVYKADKTDLGKESLTEE